MPYKDEERRKEANRERMRRARGAQGTQERGAQACDSVRPGVRPGKQSPVVPWMGEQAMVNGELVPVRCWHCGSYHQTVQLARDCRYETEFATYGTRPDKKALVDVRAISDSLARGRLGGEVRFGCFGPTFGEIGEVLSDG